jgi:hypothetical protein
VNIQPIRDYLSGARFDNALMVELPRELFPKYDRTHFLRALCKDKNVIHIGYVAHKENVDAHIRKGIWLHKHLLDWSKRCIGIDIDCEGVELLAEKYKYYRCRMR